MVPMHNYFHAPAPLPQGLFKGFSIPEFCDWGGNEIAMFVIHLVYSYAERKGGGGQAVSVASKYLEWECTCGWHLKQLQVLLCNSTLIY